MSKKRLIVLLLNIIFICLLIFGAKLYCDKRLEMKKAYIAKYDLVNRTLISDDEIEEVLVPSNYLNKEVLTKKEEIIGKFVKINTIVPKGSFFYNGALDELSNMKDSINSSLNEGEVSFDIPANKISVNQAYLLKGMYVDLYLTVNKDRVVSDLLINNVKVIGLYDINHKEIKDYDNESLLGTLSLAVPSNSVSYLNKAMVVGELSVVVGNNTYSDVKTSLNKTADIFEYLD